jgi:hypothetical protein
LPVASAGVIMAFLKESRLKRYFAPLAGLSTIALGMVVLLFLILVLVIGIVVGAISSGTTDVGNFLKALKDWGKG